MVICFNATDYKNCDVLIRVYENQAKIHSEEKQCVGEILFSNDLVARTKNKDYEHYRVAAMLPRGVAEGIVTRIKEILPSLKNLTINVCNEFPNKVGALTSCRENFDLSFQRSLKENRII